MPFYDEDGSPRGEKDLVVAANFFAPGKGAGVVVHSLDEEGEPNYGDVVELRRGPLVLKDVDLHVAEEAWTTLGKVKVGVASAVGTPLDGGEREPSPEHERVRLNVDTERFETEDGREVLGASEALLLPENRQMWAKDLRLASVAEAVREYKEDKKPRMAMPRETGAKPKPDLKPKPRDRRGRGGQEFGR